MKVALFILLLIAIIATLVKILIHTVKYVKLSTDIENEVTYGKVSGEFYMKKVLNLRDRFPIVSIIVKFIQDNFQ